MTLPSRLAAARPSSSVLVAAGAAAFVAALVGCGDSGGTSTGSTCPQGSTLTYENFGRAFIQTNCNGCHGASQSPTLTTQAAVQANATRIDELAASGPNATNTTMPEGASVSVEDRQKLGEWLACGAP